MKEMEQEKNGRYQNSRDYLDGKQSLGVFAHYPKTLSRLNINNNFYIEMTTKIPNIWFRFWYKILLGWKWENLNEK